MRKRLLLFIGAALCITGYGGCASTEMFAESKIQSSTEVPEEAHVEKESSEFELDMVNAYHSELAIDIENEHIMTGGDAQIRGIPDEKGKVNRTLSYQMVDVYAVVYGEMSVKWALVGFFCFDEAYNDIGWVKVSDLMEYKEENYHLLRYPVTVKEGCVDLDKGEAVKWDAFRVEYAEDYALVSREGGWSRRVNPEDIVYPSYEKKEELVPQGYEVDPDRKSEFDYECYIAGLNLSADGQNDKLLIHQIEYIYASDTEEIEKYGLENEDWSPGYYIMDDSEEILALPINEETEFLVINWGNNQELADNSINRSMTGYCLLKDSAYFFEHMQNEYGEKLTDYPMFIIMGDDGYVHQVVELPLP